MPGLITRPSFLSMLSLVAITFAFGQGDDKSSTRLDGTVQYYKPGEWIAVQIRPQVEKKYNLADKDCTYTLGPGVEVGSKVNIQERKDSSGKKTVAIRLKS